MAAGLAAGMEVIAVTTELTRQKFRERELLDRCRVVYDIKELPTVVRRVISDYGEAPARKTVTAERTSQPQENEEERLWN